MSNNVLVDTGYWIAFFDPQDDNHANACQRGDWLDVSTLVFPWPVLYETLRTRFMRRPEWVLRLDRLVRRPNVQWIDDAAYCEDAYSLAAEYSVRLRRPMSMVDMLCRLLIEDPGIKIDYLLTTNSRDFEDACRKRNIQLL